MGTSKRTKKDRRYIGTSRNRPDNLKFRKEEAQQRQEAYDKLSIDEKLARLPEPPACAKQRAKLLAQKNGTSKPKNEEQV
jgi:hypothetical protein